MAKLERVTQKIFAESAGVNDVGVIGSLHEGNPTVAENISDIMSLPAFENGLRSVVIGENSPNLEEDNAMYKMLTYQLAYLMQSGIPEWDANTTYYRGNIVRGVNAEIYICNDLGTEGTTEPVYNTDYWFRFNFNPFQWPDNFVERRKIGSPLIGRTYVNEQSIYDLDISLTPIIGSEITVANKNTNVVLKVCPDSGSSAIGGGANVVFSKPIDDLSECSFVIAIERKVGASGAYEIFRTFEVARYRAKSGNAVINDSLAANLNFEATDSIVNAGQSVFYRLSAGMGFTDGFTNKSLYLNGLCFKAEYE